MIAICRLLHWQIWCRLMIQWTISIATCTKLLVSVSCWFSTVCDFRILNTLRMSTNKSIIALTNNKHQSFVMPSLFQNYVWMQMLRKLCLGVGFEPTADTCITIVDMYVYVHTCLFMPLLLFFLSFYFTYFFLLLVFIITDKIKKHKFCEDKCFFLLMFVLPFGWGC